jgi:hypothetical protein
VATTRAVPLNLLLKSLPAAGTQLAAPAQHAWLHCSRCLHSLCSQSAAAFQQEATAFIQDNYPGVAELVINDNLVWQNSWFVAMFPVPDHQPHQQQPGQHQYL